MKARLSSLLLALHGILQNLKSIDGFVRYSSTRQYAVETLRAAQIDNNNDVTEIRLPPYAANGDSSSDEVSSNCNSYASSVLHSIYVKPFLSNNENAELLQLVRAHANATGRWRQRDTDRHSTYATCDFPIDDAPTVQAYLNSIDFDERMWTALEEHYGIPAADLSYLDFFCVQYQAENNNTKDSSTNIENDNVQSMDRLEAHRDGSLLSFTITLSDPQSDFVGGGTFFEALRHHEGRSPLIQPGGVVRPSRAGDAVLHSGKALHGADVVTTGERIVLVGFVDVAPWHQRPGVLIEACRTWGRLDVALKRHARQVEKTRVINNDDGTICATMGWHLAIQRLKWLPGTDASTGRGRSYVANYCPASSTVVKLADPTYQRLERLKAEDVLLRNILLSRQEVDEMMAGFGDSGEITIL